MNGLTLQPFSGSERASSRLFSRSASVWPGSPAMKPELTFHYFSPAADVPQSLGQRAGA